MKNLSKFQIELDTITDIDFFNYLIKHNIHIVNIKISTNKHLNITYQANNLKTLQNFIIENFDDYYLLSLIDEI